LINDKKLIEHAKEFNYKLIYLIHPILSPQIKDFDTNEYVQIIPGAGNVSYEKMLSEASLMLTDHSGIQFDFAYMRKPLVYYHPDSLPPQYEEGGLKYETMGFGPVCKNHEQVVDALCKYMAKDCVMHEEYKERVEKFFAFNDHKNCERIYEAAVSYINDKKQ
jgi:CDP-glycerol glycerophosphotransferase (TagB/SpsB family)